MPENLFYLFDCVRGAAKNKKFRRGFLLVWHMVLWVLWRARNKAIFKNIVEDPKTLVDEVKILSWKWSADRLKIAPCLFYEWSWDPGDCFMR
jgi:hypothetical protein